MSWTKVAEIQETHVRECLDALAEGVGGGLTNSNYLADGAEGTVSFRGQEYRVTVKPLQTKG
jgi:hypothetical protein